MKLSPTGTKSQIGTSKSLDQICTIFIAASCSFDGMELKPELLRGIYAYGRVQFHVVQSEIRGLMEKY